jgi:NADPH2:quinone reductase
MSDVIPQMMNAVAINEPGGPEVLLYGAHSVPQPEEHELLVRVVAAGVNRPDLLQRRGMYPVPADASPLPGLEIAGVVVATGADATRWRIGESIMALSHGGGYAEYCCVHQDHCLSIPETLTFVEAAAFAETFFTVWYNVFMRCALKSGETLLVHGGSSGIGTTAIQLAKAFGCTVITTAGSDQKCRFCEDLGADIAINYKSSDWAEVVAAHTNNRGVDVLLDMVAGPYLQKNINAMARDGRYAIIAFLGGTTAELNMRDVVTKRLTITGSTLRPQTIAEKAAIAADLATKVGPLLETEAVKPIIHATYPLADAADAHALMESSQHMGKIVLTVRESE